MLHVVERKQWDEAQRVLKWKGCLRAEIVSGFRDKVKMHQLATGE